MYLNKPYIAIAYAVDQNVSQQAMLAVSIFSLLKNSHKSTYYKINILHQNISDAAMVSLQKICDYYQNADLNFINCEPFEKVYRFDAISMQKNKMKIELPSPAFYRLLIPELLG